MDNKLPRIYYVSQGTRPEVHLKNIENVCLAGVQLVQLRLKGVSTEEYLDIALEAKSICEKHGSLLVINDNVDVAASLDLGLHLGQEDGDFSVVRKQLPDSIIGLTANTLDQVVEGIEQNANYIGLGPFRHTTTKKNLSPILGHEGYRKILSSGSIPEEYPVYAIGGIRVDDVAELLSLGVYGVAVSGLLSNKTSDALAEIMCRLSLLKKKNFAYANKNELWKN